MRSQLSKKLKISWDILPCGKPSDGSFYTRDKIWASYPGQMGLLPLSDLVTSHLSFSHHPPATLTFLRSLVLATGSSPPQPSWALLEPHIATSFSGGIFPTQKSNPHLLCWQADSLPLSHLGKPHDGICLYTFYMTTWMDLEGIVLNEMSNRVRQVLFDLTYAWNLKQSKQNPKLNDRTGQWLS